MSPTLWAASALVVASMIATVVLNVADSRPPPPQLIFATSWLAISSIIISILYIMYRRSVRGGPDTTYITITGLRRAILVVLIVGLASAFIASLPAYPYSGFKERPVYSVKVEAVRFSWIMNATEVPANKPIAFLVTSRDVNHGFGLYTADGRLIAQTQAMPGYVNVLVVTLPAGEYVVVCMEYCGVAHHLMVKRIRAVG